MKQIKKKQITSIIMLILAGIVWGASFVVVKDSLDYLTPLWQVALRLSIAAVPALILIIINHKKINRKLIIRCIILGCIFAAALIIQNIGLKYTTASKSAFLTGTYVTFIPIIELVILRHRLKPRRIIAAAMCMTGTAILTLQSNFIIQWGDIIVIGCGLFYAIHILYIEKISDEDPVLLHSGQIIVATVIAVALAAIFEPLPDVNIFKNTSCIMGLLYCGIFEVFLGFFFQMLGQQNTNPALAGILLSMESMYGAVFAVIFLGDKMGIQIILGGTIMLASAIINGIGDGKQ